MIKNWLPYICGLYEELHYFLRCIDYTAESVGNEEDFETSSDWLSETSWPFEVTIKPLGHITRPCSTADINFGFTFRITNVETSEIQFLWIYISLSKHFLMHLSVESRIDLSFSFTEVLECRTELSQRAAGKTKFQLFCRIVCDMTRYSLYDRLPQQTVVRRSPNTGTLPTRFWYSETSMLRRNREEQWSRSDNLLIIIFDSPFSTWVGESR